MAKTTRIKATESKAGASAAAPERAARAPRVTKKQELIRLLRRKAGADIGSLSDTFGWQNHTTRAALSGLRKAGYEIVRIDGTNGKPARYRIEAAPPKPKETPDQEKAATDAA